MASDDIAVPDLAYFIEHDIREAIRQMDEAGLSAHALEASSALGDPALSSISPTQPLLPPKPVKSEPKVKPKKPRKKKKAAKGADGTKGVRKFVSPVRCLCWLAPSLLADECVSARSMPFSPTSERKR